MRHPATFRLNPEFDYIHSAVKIQEVDDTCGFGIRVFGDGLRSRYRGSRNPSGGIALSFVLSGASAVHHYIRVVTAARLAPHLLHLRPSGKVSAAGVTLNSARYVPGRVSGVLLVMASQANLASCIATGQTQKSRIGAMRIVAGCTFHIGLI